MKPAVIIIVFLLTFTNAVIIYGRCGSSEYAQCTYGECYEYNLELYTCTVSPSWGCTNGTNFPQAPGAYYYLTESEGGYYFRTFNEPTCTIAATASEIYCDSCVNWDTAFCNSFYLECGEVFFASLTIILLFGCFFVGILFFALIFCASIVYYVKKKQESTLEKTPIIEITNEQATYQTSPYGYETAVFRGNPYGF